MSFNVRLILIFSQSHISRPYFFKALPRLREENENQEAGSDISRKLRSDGTKRSYSGHSNKTGNAAGN